MAGSLTAAIFMLLFIVGGLWYTTNKHHKPIEAPLSERIMQRECDLGMCDFAGHDHSYKLKPPPKRTIAPPPVSASRELVDLYRQAQAELERTQKELAAIKMENDEFRQKFSYRKYKSDDFENEYTVHEITAFGGEKMIYTEKYPKFSNYVGYREYYTKSERQQMDREVPKIPTKKVRI